MIGSSMRNNRRAQPESDAETLLRRLLTSNDIHALDENIRSTTLFGTIRARCHCDACDSDQVRSGPSEWSSLIGLSGECYKCSNHFALVKMVFTDSNGNIILVIHPEITKEHLLQGLCYLEQYSRIRELKPTGDAVKRVTTPSGGFFYAVGSPHIARVPPLDNPNVTVRTPLVSGNNQALANAITNSDFNVLEQLITFDNIDDVITRGFTALFYACYFGSAGKLDVVKWLLAKGANPNAPSKDMLTPLHGAAGANIENEEVVRLLLDHKDRDGNPNGVHVNAINAFGHSPLHSACSEGHVATATLLINRGANVRIVTTEKATPLHLAARGDKNEMVKLLLDAGAPLDPLDLSGRTPLCNAIYCGKKLVGTTLLENGANVGLVKVDLAIPEWAGGEAARVIANQAQVNSEPQPQLFLTPQIDNVMLRTNHQKDEKIVVLESLFKQHIEIKTKLADTRKKNAILQDQLLRVNQQLSEKLTLLHKAQQLNTELDQKTAELYQRLLPPSDSVFARSATSSEGSVNTLRTCTAPVSSVTDVQPATLHQVGDKWALYKAIVGGHDISPFINLDNIDDEIHQGLTALFIASLLGKVEIVKWLLARGANVHGRSKNEKTPLHAAASAESVEVVRLLLDHKDRDGNLNGADVNDIDYDGTTPLHLSCAHGKSDISALLIERGAHVKAVIHILNNTPLHLAAREGHDGVVKLLLQNGASVDSLNSCNKTPLYDAIYQNRVFAGRVLLASGADVGKVNLPIPAWVRHALTEIVANRAQFASSVPTVNETVAIKSNDQKDMTLRTLENRNKSIEPIQRKTSEELTLARSKMAKLQNQLWLAKQQVQDKAVMLDKTLQHNTVLQQNIKNINQRLLAVEGLIQSVPWQKYEDEMAACDSDEVKQKLDTWRAAQVEFIKSEEEIKIADESLLMEDQFSELVQQRYKILKDLLQLAPDVLQYCRQSFESVCKLEECVTPYATAPVTVAERAYFEHVTLLATPHEEVASKYHALKAAQKLEELQEIKSVRSKLLVEVSDACKRYKNLDDFRENASKILSQLLWLYISLNKSRKSLQHAREMSREFPKDAHYKEKAEKRNAVYLEQCEKYRQIQERIRPLSLEGFVEFKPFLGIDLGEYVIESLTGVISKAKHGEQEVALKFGSRKRIELEYHTLKRLNHSYVISVESILYLSPFEAMLVLPWINGVTLDVWLGQMKPSEAQIRQLFRDIIHGLEYVHANKIVHGKICPKAIMIDLIGPRICDFSHSEDPTFVSNFAPADEEKTLDVYNPHCEPKSPALDVYALAVCLFRAYFNQDPLYVANESYPRMPATHIPGLLHVLKGMLNSSPEKRPAASALTVQFGFFKSLVETHSQSRIKAFRASMALVCAANPQKKLVTFAKNCFITDVANLLCSTNNIINLQLDVKFEDEDGIDYGALTIAMFERFLKEVSSPAFGLFEAGQDGKLLPRMLTELSKEQLMILQAYGLALARVIINGYAINVPLASAFYKYLHDDLLNQKTIVTMDHLEGYDYQHSQILVRLLSPTTTDYSLHNFDDFGETSRQVTKFNVHEYVHKWIQAKMIDTRMMALSAISQGFKCLGDVVNQHIAILTPKDIQLLVCGENLPSSALIDRLRFEGFHANDSTPNFLKNIISKMTHEDLTVFLHFITAQETLPITCDKIIKITHSNSSQHRLPEAHVCFWELQISTYSNEEDLRRDLMMAIHESHSAFTLH